MNNRRRRRLQATRDRAEMLDLKCDMCGRVAVQFVRDERNFASFLGTQWTGTARCERHPVASGPECPHNRTMSVETFLLWKVQES